MFHCRFCTRQVTGRLSVSPDEREHRGIYRWTLSRLDLRRQRQQGEPPRRFGPPAHDQRAKHRVVGELAAPRGLGTVEEFERLRRVAPPGPALKVAVPGPYTLAGRLEGDRWERAEALLPIVQAELTALADAGCAEIAHGINIKLAKSGGIREAVRMAHAARALGLGVMLGCMIESGLGIAAGCVVAPLCDHVDLDGNLLIADDPWPGVAFVDGVQVPSDEPGLGVSAA